MVHVRHVAVPATFQKHLPWGLEGSSRRIIEVLDMYEGLSRCPVLRSVLRIYIYIVIQSIYTHTIYIYTYIICVFILSGAAVLNFRQQTHLPGFLQRQGQSAELSPITIGKLAVFGPNQHLGFLSQSRCHLMLDPNQSSVFANICQHPK